MVATQLIVFTGILLSSPAVLASHFRGAIIQWRPVTNDAESFDGTIEIMQRLAWRRSFNPPASFNCTEADINTTRLFGGSGNLVCRTGCDGVIGSVRVYCTDFNVQEDWFSGTRTYTYNLGETVTSFEASYMGTNWITLEQEDGDTAGWEVRVKGNVSPRSDNGRINSSPVTSITPVIRLQQNCNHTVRIPVQDADQDTVRCRWAEGDDDECADVCQAVPGATIDEDACKLNWRAEYSAGFYAVAIQVEDFMTPSDTTAMSSVPIQFLLNVFQSEESCSGGIRPSLVLGETPPDESCASIRPGETYTAAIVAFSGDTSASITDFNTISPFGLTLSAVTQSQFNSTHYYSNITWTPSQSQYGEPSQFSFSARNSEGFETEQYSITLYGGVTGPKALSVTPTGTFRPSSSTRWNVTFDQNIVRPNSSRFIRFYEAASGVNVYNFDVTSPAAAFAADRTLTFSFDTNFTIGIEYYILLDDGIAIGSQFCSEESIGVTNTSFWTFTSEPPVPANVEVQAVVGDPFSLFVSWNAPALDLPDGVYIVNYTVQCQDSQTGQESGDTVVGGGRLNATITELDPFTKYGCYVSANPSVGIGGSSDSIFQETNEFVPDDPPTDLQVSVVTATSVYFSWSPPLTPNGVIVSYSILVEELDSQSNTALSVGAVNSTTVEDLLPYRNYSLSVAASTSVGMGPYEVLTVRTLEDIPSGSPQMFNGTVDSSRSMTFSWTGPLEDQQNGVITGYTLNITEVGTGATIQRTVPGSQTTLTVTSLQPFTSYTSLIAASTSVGLGPFSTAITVLTPEDVPSDPPTGLQVSMVTAVSVNISWSPPLTPNGIVVSYTILVEELDSQTNTTISVGVVSSTTVESLLPYRGYSFRVAASTSAGLGPYEVATATTLEDIPSDPPTNLQVSMVAATSVYLSWSPPLTPNGVIVSYTILVKELNSQTDSTTSVEAVNSTVEGLLPYREYNFSVAASTSVGMGPYHEMLTVRTLEDVPSGSPQMFVQTVDSSRSVTFSWTEPLEDQQNGVITGYTLNITEVGTGATIQRTVPGSQTTLTVTSLQPFTFYASLIAASTSVGLGPFSTAITTMTPEDVPDDPPTDLQVSMVTAFSVYLSWSPPLTPNGVIVSYSILVEEEAPSQSSTSILVSNTNSTVDNLSPYRNYNFSVAASTSVGMGPYKVVTARTLEEISSGSPQMFNGTADSSDSITFSWTEPLEDQQNGVIVSYTLNITEEGTGLSVQRTVSSSQTTLTVTSLQPFTSYLCSIAASTSVGTGPFSSAIMVMTLEASPSMPPTNLSGSALDSTTILLSWDPPSGDHNGIIREYRLNVTEVETGVVTELVSATTDLTVSNLHPDYTYQWIVTAFTVDEGPFSDPSVVRTPEDVPSGPPMEIVSESLDSRAVSLRWRLPRAEERNGEIIGYIVRITDKDTGESQQFVANLASNFTFSTPRPNTEYSVEIAAYNIAGTGSFSTAVDVLTPEDVPGAPIEVKATIVTGSSIMLTWFPPTNPNGDLVEYIIYYHGYNDEGETVVILDGPDSIQVSAEQTSNLFEDLNGALSYSFVVQTRTAVGAGANSTAATVDLSLANVVCGPNTSIGIVLAIVGWCLLIVLLIIVTTTKKPKAAKVEV